MVKMTLTELEKIKKKNLETLVRKLEANDWTSLNFNIGVSNDSEFDLERFELNDCLSPQIVEAIKKLVLIGFKQKLSEINK
jgi:hypothetical protein